MPSPQLNLRVPLEHHDLLKAVAGRLRTDAAFADRIAALLAGVAAPVADASNLASIMSRLEVLEALKDRVEALELRMRKEGAGTVAGSDGTAMAVGRLWSHRRPQAAPRRGGDLVSFPGRRAC
jgi:hypothetical protein